MEINIYGWFLLAFFGGFMFSLVIMGVYESWVIDRILARLHVDYSKQVGILTQLKKARAVQELGPAFAKQGRKMHFLIRSTVVLFLFTILLFIAGAVFAL